MAKYVLNNEKNEKEIIYPFKYPGFRMIVYEEQGTRFEKLYHWFYLYDLNDKKDKIGCYGSYVNLCLPSDYKDIEQDEKQVLDHFISQNPKKASLYKLAIPYFYNLSSKLFLEKMRKKGIILS